MQYAIRSLTGSHKHVDGKTFCNVAYRVLDDADVSDEILDHEQLEVLDAPLGVDDPILKGKQILTGIGKKGVLAPPPSKEPRRVGSRRAEAAAKAADGDGTPKRGRTVPADSETRETEIGNARSKRPGKGTKTTAEASPQEVEVETADSAGADKAEE